MSYSSIIWIDDYGYTTHGSLYIILKGKEQVPDDVVDVLVLMIYEELLTNRLEYKKRNVVTWPLALAMQKMQSVENQAAYIMEDMLYGHKQVELILMPVILNGYYHLLILENPSQNYLHYSSLMLETYDADAEAMVSHSNTRSYLLLTS